jgi:hypothetical protein
MTLALLLFGSMFMFTIARDKDLKGWPRGVAYILSALYLDAAWQEYQWIIY